jgi:hypothetical protein
MARAPFKHPSVFVACPYTPAATFKAFREALRRIPLEFHYADSAIKTAHVVERIRRGIVRCDYSIFDITDWNANVTLELGLAEGLNKDYYILFKPGRGKKAEPPSDIKGLQRIQYTKIDGFDDNCLAYQLNHQLVRRLTHPRYVYDQLSGANRDKAFIVAMRILAHFKEHQLLHRRDLQPLVGGSYLRDEAVEQLLEILRGRNLLSGRLDGQKWKAGRSLYKKVTF